MPGQRHNISANHKRALSALRRLGAMRSRQLEEIGLTREAIRSLVARGKIRRVSRGVYVDAVGPTSGFLEVCTRLPKGTVCLLSALAHHGIGTQNPHQVWIAIDVKARKPKEQQIPLRIVRFGGDALTAGIEETGGVRVTSPARTVVDCFKYRHKIGLDVALEALRDGWRNRRFTMDELWELAGLLRVRNVMRPYLEFLE